MEATNRQKKFLTFFKIPFSPDLSTGAAGWEISEILQDEKCRDRWWRYKFLTQDFGSDSPHVKPFTEAELDAVVFPEGWDADKEGEKFEVELAAQIMADGAPFDVPQPPIQVEGRSFMFTGKFTFGTRNACHKAILDRGG